MKSNSPNLQVLQSLRLEQNTKSKLNALSHIICHICSMIETNLNVKYEMQCKYDWHDMLLKNLSTTNIVILQIVIINPLISPSSNQTTWKIIIILFILHTLHPSNTPPPSYSPST